MGSVPGPANDARTRPCHRREPRASRRKGGYRRRGIVPPLPKAASQPRAGVRVRTMNNATSISIIVPVLNEAAQLQASLTSVGPLDKSLQLVVVDGGSTDDSLAVAR